MNSDLLRQAAEALAGMLQGQTLTDDKARVKHAYRKTIGREPTGSETARALAFLDEYARAQDTETTPDDRRLAAWQALCRVLLGTSELIFIE